MSKSRGNVYYPNDLLAKGFRKDHVRFFLIYGHYREKLNFTWKNLAETSRKLDSFKSMVQALEKAESPNSWEKAEKLANSIISSFEARMNDDLDVKAAFDTIYTTVAALHKRMKQGKLDVEEVQAAMRSLRRMDRFLQVIF